MYINRLGRVDSNMNKEGYTNNMDTEYWAAHWADDDIEEVSDCCGANVHDDHDICSSCNDHCGREAAEQ